LSRYTQNSSGIWLQSQIARNARVFKYGIVGCAGILTNLGTMALILTASSQRGWAPSAIANIVSTMGNFVLHNLWTFSDRQHQGLRLVRGFLSFALMSVLGIAVTTTAYVGFTRVAANVTITNSHSGSLAIVLPCQFAAILFGASLSYALNRAYTWPPTQTQETSTDASQVQEI
jgi:putative flippase GtrA